MNVPELQKYLDEAKPTLVMFYRPGDAPCEEMMPTVEKLREYLGDRANVLRIDGTKDANLRELYHVFTYPTWIVFKDNTIAWRDSGRKDEGELEHMVRRFE